MGVFSTKCWSFKFCKLYTESLWGPTSHAECFEH